MSDREAQLEAIIRELYWMARRYAHGRRTYAPDYYNRAIAAALNAGVDLKPPSGDGTIWAKDGDCGWPLDLIEKHGCHVSGIAETRDLL